MAFMARAAHVLQCDIQREATSQEQANPKKASPSSDCRLKPACMKPESLVIAGQHTAVNMFLSLVHTARQATKVGCARSRRANPQGKQAPKVNSAIGTKS